MIKLIKKYFYQIEWLFIVGFIALLPAIFSNKLMDPGLYSRFLGLSWLLLILSVIFLYKVYKKEIDISFKGIEWIIFGCALLYFANHIISSIGVINGKEAVFKALKEGAFMLYFFYMYIFLRNTANARNLVIKSIIASTLFFLLIGVYQLIKADFTIFTNASNYYAYYLTQALINVKSTLASKNPFSSFLFLSLPFVIYGVIIFRKLWRVLSIITLLLSFVFIGLLVSKTVWAALGLFMVLGFVLFLVHLFFVMPKNSGKSLKLIQKIAVLVLPVFIVVGSVVFVAKSDIKVFKVISDKVLQVVNPDEHMTIYSIDNPTSIETRTIAWGKTFKMIKEHPLLGVGPGHWRIYLPNYGLNEFDNGIRQGTMHFQRTHNDFLWIAAEIGLLGLLFYLLIYGTILVLAWRNFIKSSCKEVRVLNGLIFATLIGYIVILFISFSRERIPHNIVYLAMFAIVIFDNWSKLKSNNNRKKTSKMLVFFGAFILLFSIFNLYVAKDIFNGEKEFRKMQYYQRVKKNYRGVYRSAKKLETTFYTMDPFSMPISFYKGSAEHKQNDVKAATISFQEAYKIHPYNIQVILNLATSYDLLKKPDEAIKYYSEALRISPRYHDALINISIVYYNKKDYKKAFSYFSQIPYDKNLPDRYNKAVYAICVQYAITLQDKLDIKKLNIWLKDKNKVVDSFVKFQQESTSFSQIMLQDFGK